MSEHLTQTLTDLADDYGTDAVLAECARLFHVLPSTPSRASDRDTSVASGNRKASRDVGRFDVTSVKFRVLLYITQQPRTALEAAQRHVDQFYGETSSPSAAMRIETARKRVSDLARAGLIEDSGERRKNEGSPDESVVWRVTEQGHRAMNWLASTGWSK